MGLKSKKPQKISELIEDTQNTMDMMERQIQEQAIKIKEQQEEIKRLQHTTLMEEDRYILIQRIQIGKKHWKKDQRR